MDIIYNCTPVSYSIPAKIRVREKHDSPDTVENQFIKYALSVYKFFCSDIKSKMDTSSRGYKEAENLEESLNNFLDHSLFKGISQPDKVIVK